jgi:hypothetical protein
MKMNTQQSSWGVTIVAKDASGVTLVSDAGDTQWLSWEDWKTYRKNRCKNPANKCQWNESFD